MKIWSHGRDVCIERPFLSGYFRDGRRRIDLVLVSAESKLPSIELLKTNFLANCTQAGFDLEIEWGVKKEHRNLAFIKIHTPFRLLNYFSTMSNMQKIFKQNHLDLVKSWTKDEVPLIKVIRKMQPTPMYSTLERSQITYWLLHSVRFDLPENYIGIHTLLKQHIFVDAYALHDGPHFLLTKQVINEFNNRQALFYKWIGYKRLFSLQPIHLIREYMGERVAFLFAFYEFYILTMVLPAILSAGSVIWGNLNMQDRVPPDGKRREYFSNYSDTAGVPNITVTDNFPVHKRLPVCPRCSDFVACPYTPLNNYRREIEIKLWLANTYTLLGAFAVIAWAIMFSLFWKRKEYYLNWLWEVDEVVMKRMKRPDYHKPKVAPLGKLGRVLFKILEFGKYTGIMILYVVAYLPLLIVFEQKLLNRLRYTAISARTEHDYRFTHFLIIMASSINGFLIVIIERLSEYFTTILTKLDNPRTYEQFEAGAVSKMFGFSFILNFGWIFFYAFVKGIFYTTPNDEDRWNMPLQLGMMNCGVLSCIDELFVAFVATYKAKRFFRDIIEALENRVAPTDVTCSDDVGCWEREYELMPVDNDLILSKYNRIFVDIVEATFFVLVCPWTPIVSLLLNIWEIRSWAYQMLLKCRRPLMFQQWGLGTWSCILFLLPYTMVLCNMIIFARTTNYIDHETFNIYLNNRTDRSNDSFYLDYYLNFFCIRGYFKRPLRNISDYLIDIKPKTDMQKHVATYHRNWHHRTVYDDANNLLNFTKAVGSETLFRIVYKKRPGPPFFCLYPGQWYQQVSFRSSVVFENELYTEETTAPIVSLRSGSKTKELAFIQYYSNKLSETHYYLLFIKALMILFAQLCTIFTGLFFHSLIKEKTDIIEYTKDVEEVVKHFGDHRDLIQKLGQDKEGPSTRIGRSEHGTQRTPS